MAAERSNETYCASQQNSPPQHTAVRPNSRLHRAVRARILSPLSSRVRRIVAAPRYPSRPTPPSARPPLLSSTGVQGGVENIFGSER
uniref:Uncharacterized protein n=1 Tax=Oryza meridionalis TaxID=40149 RepID=A0A0E0E9D1_9ORYZ